MGKIKDIKARQILDSRGNPTVEAEVWTESGAWGRAAVPSGASTGSREALELRDGEMNYYMGKSVKQAVAHIREVIKPALIGFEVTDQKSLDERMLTLDGTENKSKLGANALLAVSMAACRAGANEMKLPLFRYMKEQLKIPNCSQGEYLLPTPLMNIINGGEHASNNLDIQEFMIVPRLAKSFAENLRAGVEIFHSLKKVLSDRKYSTNVGDEGGFAPNLSSHEEALELILMAIEKAGYAPGKDVMLALDAAASEFYRENHYHMQGKSLNTEGMLEYYSGLCAKYPIYSIEDGLDEGDHAGWTKLTKKLSDKTLLIGDDLFVTNRKILTAGIEHGEANAILIKVNQIGTLSETFDALQTAFEHGYKAVISHRSGETGDSFIADLAVACGCGHIKTGSASRSDRMEKYNQLLRIEELLGSDAQYRPVVRL